MKMNKFTLGVLAGVSTVALGLTFLAQASSAQNTSSTAAPTRTPPTQACVESLAALENARLSSMDATQQAHKDAIQAYAEALTSAASITDDTQRDTAVRTARDTLRTALEKLTPSDAEKSAMEAVQTTCGASSMFPDAGPMGPHGMMGRGGPHDDHLAQKLGLTTDQLKSELQSGKTIQQIAQEHGVTLPEPPKGRHEGWGGPQDPPSSDADATPSAQQ